MGASNRSVVIDVGVKLELDKKLNQLEDQLSAIETIGKNSKLTKPLQSQLENIKTDMVELRKLMNDFGNSKIDASAFEDFKKDIEKKIGEIKDDISGFSGALENLQKTVDGLSGTDLTKNIRDWEEKFESLSTSIKNTYDGLKSLMSLAQSQGFDFGFSNAAKDMQKTNEELKQQLKYWREIYTLSKTTGRWRDNRYEPSKSKLGEDIIDSEDFEEVIDNFDKHKSQLEQALSEYRALKNEYDGILSGVAGGKNTQNELDEITKKLTISARKLSGLSAIFGGTFSELKEIVSAILSKNVKMNIIIF